MKNQFRSINTRHASGLTGISAEKRENFLFVSMLRKSFAFACTKRGELRFSSLRSPHRIRSAGTAAGFTLIEVMVVVVILGILAAIIVPKIMSRPEQARLVKVKQDITAIQSALDLYKLDNGTYPTTDQGLSALVTKPTMQPIPRDWKSEGYLQDLPTDPWGQAYQYLNDSERVRIFSYGPKGKDANSQIGNWNMNGETQSL